MNGSDPCGVGAGPPSNRSITLKSKLKPALVIVAMIVLLGADQKIMKRQVSGKLSLSLTGTATALMGLAGVATIVTLIAGR